MNLLLRRDPPAPGHVTFGTLEGAGGPYQTLELPFIPLGAGSDHGSCVPQGIYTLVRHSSETHPFTWALVNETLGVYAQPADIPPDAVGARSTILLHPGNTALDTEGCILVGLARSFLFTTPGVVESRLAFDTLKAHLPWVEGHTVTILGDGASPS